ncbi:MAG TPA: hypothetical protein VM008_22410 [Phycisphaerae bacterium]|nr:hypothetical protein [Phycisphaerae bacterium]
MHNVIDIPEPARDFYIANPPRFGAIVCCGCREVFIVDNTNVTVMRRGMPGQFCPRCISRFPSHVVSALNAARNPPPPPKPTPDPAHDCTVAEPKSKLEKLADIIFGED